MGAAQTREYVDSRYEDRDIHELPDAPVEALRGLGKRGGEALRKAFGVKTIRDLAINDFVLKAQEVLRLAEGPAAIPTAAPAAAGADAAGHQRERAGQQALTRSEEELEVDTKQVPRGQASVRKQVVTEQQRRTVPVEREELRVQREPDHGR
jgi:ribosomal protein L12E/L44/L45/RPP1/RPP2